MYVLPPIGAPASILEVIWPSGASLSFPMASNSLVYFEGEWTEDEIVLIQTAAEAAEPHASSNGVESRSAPWVAVAHVMDDVRVYLASRRGFGVALKAETAEALAEKIRHFEGAAPLPRTSSA